MLMTHFAPAGVNEERLVELSKERTKELQIIELERKALLEREREMDAVVNKVESDLNAQTDRMNSRMKSLQDQIDKSQSKDREGALKEEKGLREKFERDYGHVMAKIEKEKEQIMKEKKTLAAKELAMKSDHHRKEGEGRATAFMRNPNPSFQSADDEDSLEKYLKELGTNKGHRSLQDRIKKLKQQQEEDAQEDQDLVKEAETTAKRVKDTLPLPKDAEKTLESWLSGESKTLDYKDVAISPTRTREKVVIKKVYVQKEDTHEEKTPEGGMNPSLDTDEDEDEDEDKDNQDKDDEDEDKDDDDADSDDDDDEDLPSDSIDQMMNTSSSRPKTKGEKKGAKKGHGGDISAEIEALKAAAANNPNINKAQVYAAIAQLEEEARMQRKGNQAEVFKQGYHDPNQFMPRMNSYGIQSMGPHTNAPPPPHHMYNSNADSSSQVMQMQMQMQLMQQQQEQRQQQAMRQMQQQMQQQMQSYMQMFQQQTQQMEAENQRLQDEVANLADIATSGPQNMGFYGGQMGAPMQQQQQQPAQQQQLQPPAQQQQQQPIHIHSASGDENDMMSFMNSLPESKRLEKLKIDHLEYMAKLRFQKER